MAEAAEPEPSEEIEPPFVTGETAIAAALDEAQGEPSLKPDLAAFFTAHRILAEAQRHHLHLQLRQLHLRTAGDVIKLALQVVSLVAVVAVLGMVGGAIRDAMNDHGLVIDSFSAPANLAAQGVTGQTLAEDLQARIAAIRGVANANSITVSEDVRGGDSDSLKVEIPQTGLSLDEVDRFLRRKLGHGRRLSGELRDDGAGHLILDLHLGGADPITVEGESGDLDKVMGEAAEKAFAAFDPTNDVVYLRATGRPDAALVAVRQIIPTMTAPLDVANTLGLTANSNGDRSQALAEAQLSSSIDPDAWSGWYESANASRDLGHDEAMLGYLRRLLKTRTQDQWRGHRVSMPWILRTGRTRLDALLGDYGQEGRDLDQKVPHNVDSLANGFVERATVAAGLHDCALASHNLAAAHLAGPVSAASDLTQQRRLALCRGDVAATLQAARGLVAAGEQVKLSDQTQIVRLADILLQTRDRPRLAQALVGAGRWAEAQAIIAATPLDCYLCLRVRGQVAAATGNVVAADRWFAAADRSAPSLPWAPLDWAQARLARGDFAGAITELAKAHARSPDFADPLELWGETLARTGDWRGAAGKFAAADKIAPRWGHLHLKWAETLAKLDRSGDAQAQFATAAALALSDADTAELARERLKT